MSTAARSPTLVSYSVPRYQVLLLLFGIAVSVLAGVAMYAGDWPAAVVIISVTMAVWMVIQPRPGLYMLLAMVLIIEGTSAIPFAQDMTPLYRSWETLMGIPFLPISPLETGLLLLMVGTTKEVVRSKGKLQFGDLFWPLSFVTALFVYSVARAYGSGAADNTIAVHELRALLYLLPGYFVTANLIRERKHLHQLAIVFIGAMIVMASGAMFRHLNEIRPGQFAGNMDLGFAHENAIFAGFVVVMMVAALIWGKDFRSRVLLLAPGILAMAAIMVMKRRVGVVAMDAGILIACMVLLRYNWRLFITVMPIVMVAGIIYLSIFWNAGGGLGQGARAFRAVIGQDVETDLSSKSYREREASNVRQNILWNPATGLGFGRAYPMPEPLPDLTSFWPFQPYVPHNTVLWVWMKGSIIHFIVLIAFFAYAMARAVDLAKRNMDPLLRGWAILAAASVMMVFLFAWQDMGLHSMRTMFIFAFCLGLIPAVAVIARKEEEAEEAARKEAARPPAAAVGMRP